MSDPHLGCSQYPNCSEVFCDLDERRRAEIEEFIQQNELDGYEENEDE